MTGFQTWLSELAAAFRARVCWFIGHSWTVSEWPRSSITSTHTHGRYHCCARCGDSWYEKAYFDGRTQPEMFRGRHG